MIVVGMRSAEECYRNVRRPVGTCTLETSTGLQDHDRANKICADY
jgi:hypothetical protein